MINENDFHISKKSIYSYIILYLYLLFFFMFYVGCRIMYNNSVYSNFLKICYSNIINENVCYIIHFYIKKARESPCFYFYPKIDL